MWKKWNNVYGLKMCKNIIRMWSKFYGNNILKENFYKDSLSKPFKCKVNNEEKCVNEACAAIETKIADTDMFDDAACKAINYSPSIRDQYKAFLEKEEDVLHV